MITLATLSAGIAFAMDVEPIVKKGITLVGSVMETVEVAYKDSEASGASKKDLAIKLIQVAFAAIGANWPALAGLVSSMIDKLKDFYNLMSGSVAPVAVAA
jgi:hypothetical protein